jgi:hypothetical protein
VFDPGFDDGDFLPARRAAGDPALDPWFGPQPITSRGDTFLLVTRANSNAVRSVLEGDRRSTKPSVYFGEAFFRIPNELCEAVKQEVLKDTQQQNPGHSGRYTG